MGNYQSFKDTDLEICDICGEYVLYIEHHKYMKHKRVVENGNAKR